ncbi:motility associated factor glycosyltransferase family protein, partial [Campylobacter jejuni]|nr:motility associated factor glycosyltransferase family protein [Campylobacter jejuni]EAJ0032298.1 motility associated factor glycosyltransferase family protein [Campylobacter jejuni]
SRLMILETSSLDIEFFSDFCSSKPFFQFSRIYFLELMSNYYERYNEDALNNNLSMICYFKKAILSKGNDPLDALQGIEQFVYNLPQMITHPSYTELLSKRKNLSDTAIIVSTGPSLTKQLPLLKQYANKATIFCADSAYPILAKHNIKPDYVCMLERTEITAEFFNHDFGEFDKDILFICASMIHPNGIYYLKDNKRKYCLIPRFLHFSLYINLNTFGFLSAIPSVAHMSYFLSVLLNHKNIILIGQDLAYAKNGNSHPDDYQNSADYESQMYEHILTEAYGEGKVKTHEIWMLFKQYLEQLIYNYGIITYNCTEGGARIKGTIEKPFLWACENLLSKDLNKPFPKLNPLNINKQNELMLKAYNKIYKSIYHCKDFNKKLLQEYNEIKELYLTLENLQIEESKELLNFIIQKIDTIKYQIDDAKNMQDLYEILGPLLVQFELNLARIYVLNPKTPEDSFNKSLIWIKEHLEWIEMIYGHIQAQENALFENIIPLEQKLKERKLNKWMERVKNKTLEQIQ